MEAIFMGRYAPGRKLPSIREMAKLHEVSVTTVQRAMDELEHMELIHSWRTSCKRVTSDRMAVNRVRNELIEQHLKSLMECMHFLGIQDAEIPELIHRRIGVVSASGQDCTATTE